MKVSEQAKQGRGWQELLLRSAAGGSGARTAVATVIVVLIATVPFLGKPLHIDDPADLQYVRQVLREPADPYGFELDWGEGPRPAYQNYHPPLKYYYHALVLWGFGFSEVALHLSYLPFVCLAGWAVVVLARHFGCPPLLALVFWMLGPGYLPGQNAMLDVPAVGLSLAGTALLVQGVHRESGERLSVAGLLLGAALLTKYSAVIYLPVWFGYLLLRGRWRQLAVLAIPVGMLAGWSVLSAWCYGWPHPLIMVRRVPGQAGGLSGVGRLGAAASFLGGTMPAGLLVLLAAGPAGRRRGRVALVGGLMAAAAVGGALVAMGGRHQEGLRHLSAVNMAWWLFLIATGFSVMALAAMRLAAGLGRPVDFGSGGGDDLLLAGWFWAALLPGACMSPFLAVRRVVDAALPGCLLLLRGSGGGGTGPRRCCWLAAWLNAALGLLVAAADYQFAGVYPQFASELAEELGQSHPGRIWYFGYWGWTHYARRAGIRPYVVGRRGPPPGSLLVIPEQVAKPARLGPGLGRRCRRIHHRDVVGGLPIRLMNYQAGAGYYSAAWGPLPYAWSLLPWDRFKFYAVGPSTGGHPLPDDHGGQ